MVGGARTRLRGEDGRVGLFSMVWLVLLLLLAVVLVDTGSIAVTRFELANAADKAAFQAASEFKDSHDRFKAREVAQQIVENDVPGAAITGDGFEIDARTGEVKVKLVKRAWSVVAGRLMLTRKYTKVSATGSAEPPTI
jgi:uncharacterized membrane protein